MAALQRTLLGSAPLRVDHHAAFERTDLGAGSWLEVARCWLQGSDALLDALAGTPNGLPNAAVDWQCGRRWMYDRMVDDPRLSRLYRRDDPVPHPAFRAIRAALGGRYGVSFGGFGLNYYRDGNDSVAFHRDRELRHLDDTLIAIVTLGATRPFHLRPLGGGRSIDVRPGAGDLLVMGGRCQQDWEHAVPKVARSGPRISITLRWAGPPSLKPAV